MTTQPLTPAEWTLLCKTIVSMPHEETWLAARNEALLWFCYSFGTRAGETSKYALGDVFEETGLLRARIPLGTLQAGDHRRPAWVWRTALPELRQSLISWYALYPARRSPDMPLWLSRKHRRVVHHLTRQSVFYPVKVAGCACGLDWVNPECIRLTKVCHAVARQIARERPRTFQGFVGIIEEAQREMRHKSVQRTWEMLLRGGMAWEEGQLREECQDG